jgi:hypothetical protein
MYNKANKKHDVGLNDKNAIFSVHRWNKNAYKSQQECVAIFSYGIRV